MLDLDLELHLTCEQQVIITALRCLHRGQGQAAYDVLVDAAATVPRFGGTPEHRRLVAAASPAVREHHERLRVRHQWGLFRWAGASDRALPYPPPALNRHQTRSPSRQPPHRPRPDEPDQHQGDSERERHKGDQQSVAEHTASPG